MKPTVEKPNAINVITITLVIGGFICRYPKGYQVIEPQFRNSERADLRSRICSEKAQHNHQSASKGYRASPF